VGALFLGLTLTLAGCARKASATAATAGGQIAVVTTTGMIADVAQAIGGDRVSVRALMGPGVDPHLYKASEGDVARLASADLILYNGLHLEAKMGDVIESMGRRVKVVAVSRAIPEETLIPAAPGLGGSHDPHIWFDVSLWATTAPVVRDALAELDPEGREAYAKASDAYVAALAKLGAYVAGRAAEVPEAQRVLVTAHDAFNYFGRAYGFDVRGLQGISTVAEAGAADVRALADFIAERKIPAIFIESSVPRKNVEALQAAVQARGFAVRIGGELYSDAMGSPGTPDGTYEGMVKHNIDTIVAALAGEREEAAR
jgi:manganese/zinc/iron transport system substrate-binding protein